MNSNAELVYEDLVARGRKESTARMWRASLRRFEACCGVKDGYGRDDVVKYLAQLRSDGLKQSSINVMLRPLNLLCEIQGWEGGFPKLAMPKVRRCDISRPVLTCAQVGELIVKAKEVCSERELAFLVASTTYGLRREELGSLEVLDGHVKVNTAKGGEVVVQLLPDEIKSYLVGYRGVADVRYLTRVFQSIINKVGLGLDAGYGWHSIRRSLTTELFLRDAKLIDLVRFMRWSEATLGREFGVVVLYIERRQDYIDRSVFKIHPFLPFWVLDA